jgi:hypothetical protein
VKVDADDAAETTDAAAEGATPAAEDDAT